MIDDDIALGTGNLFLNVTGNVSQNAGDTITAAGLALMVTGTTTLTDPGNNVTTIAANTGNTINYIDVDALTVGTVAALGMSISGITTSNGDVVIIAGAQLGGQLTVRPTSSIRAIISRFALLIPRMWRWTTCLSLVATLFAHPNGAVTLQAGDDIDLQTLLIVSAGTILTINGDVDAVDPDSNSGATINIDGTISSTGGTFINSGSDNDTINIAPTFDPTGTPVRPTLDGITGEVIVNSGGNEAGNDKKA